MTLTALLALRPITSMERMLHAELVRLYEARPVVGADSTTTQAELHAALTAFHGATSYEYATRDLSSAMAYAIQKAREAR